MLTKLELAMIELSLGMEIETMLNLAQDKLDLAQNKIHFLQNHEKISEDLADNLLEELNKTIDKLEIIKNSL